MRAMEAQEAALHAQSKDLQTSISGIVAAAAAGDFSKRIGKTYDDADLQRFADRFWSGYTDAPARDNVDADVAWDFYQAHEEDFVSDYAATNVSEDFAETFAVWLTPRASWRSIWWAWITRTASLPPGCKALDA